MQFSIITINYNNACGLQSTMESVIAQTYTDFEFIIIDGGSSDSSVDIIHTYEKHFSYWVSEKDTGVYHAMNKGIRQAKGEYIIFMNSGDSFYDKAVLQNVQKQFSKDYKIYYGNVFRVYPNGNTLVKTYPSILTFGFFYESSLGHQSTFINRQLFSDIFLYNEEYKVFSDWEFFICAICKHQVPYKYLDIVISKYDMNGISGPDNIKQYYNEKNTTYKRYFNAYYKEYEELFQIRSGYTNELKMFVKIESKLISRKIIYFVMKVLNKVFFK